MAEQFKVDITVDTSKLDSGLRKGDQKLSSFAQKNQQRTKLKLQVSLVALEQSLASARKEITKFRKAGNKQAELQARLKVQKLKEDVSSARKSLNNFKKSTEGAGRSMFKLNTIVKDALKSFGAFVGIRVFINFLKQASNQALELEATMANVSTLIQGDSTEAIADFRKEIVALTKVIPKDANDLGAGLYQVLSAGVTDSADALKVLEVASKAAVAGLTETNTSVDAITTVLNAYGKSADEAEQVSDIFFTTIREGKTTFPELASSIGKVANSAALAGIDFEELGAAFATTTKAGVSTEESATALNRLFLALANPTEGLKQKSRELGVEFSAAALRSQGFSSFISQLTEKFGQNEDAIFELGLDMRAFKALAILGGTGAEEFATQLDKQSEATGASAEAFEKQSETVKAELQLQKQRFQELSRVVGEFVNKALLPVIDFLGDLAQDLIQGTDNLGKITDAVKLLGKALGVLIAIKVATFISGIVASLFAAGAAINATTVSIGGLIGSLKALRLAMFAIPGSLTITAVLIGGALVFKQIKALQKAIGEANENIDAAAETSKLANDKAAQSSKKLLKENEKLSKENTKASKKRIEENNQLIKAEKLRADAAFKNELILNKRKQSLAQNALTDFRGTKRKELAIEIEALEKEVREKNRAARAITQGLDSEVKKRSKAVNQSVSEELGLLEKVETAKKASGSAAKDPGAPPPSTAAGTGAKKSIEEAEKALNKYEKEIADTNKTAEKLKNDTVKFFTDIENSIDKAKEKQAGLNNEFEQFKTKETVDFVSDAGKRDLDLLREEEALTKKLNEAQAEGGDTGAVQDDLNAVLKERQEIQTFINGLIEEGQGLTEKGLSIQEIFNKAIDDASQTQFEQNRRNFEESIAQKEAEIQAEIDKQQKIIDIQQKFLDVQGSGDEAVEKARQKLIDDATGKQLISAEERAELLKELGFQELTNEEQLNLQKQFLQAESLRQEVEAVNQQQEEILDAKEDFINQAEELQRESINRQIDDTKRLIETIEKAQQAQIALNKLKESGPTSGGTDLAGDTNINIVNNNANDIDVEAANRNLISRINR